MDLFGGIPVGDLERASAWYESLLGAGPSFLPNDTEAVWEIAEHRFLYVVLLPEHDGHARHTLFVDGLSTVMREIAGRGLEPAEQETNGVRKTMYRDPDGNEIGFARAPLG